MTNTNTEVKQLTPEHELHLLAHFRALIHCTEEMMFYQACYFKNREMSTLIKAKQAELATKKMLNICLCYEKVFNIDTSKRYAELMELATGRSL